MAQANKTCEFCHEIGHSKSYCKKRPRKPIAKVSAKKKLAPTPMSAPKKRKKRSSRAIAKEKAWDAFSYYIRIRDSLATTGTIEFCVCVTCNERGISKPKEFKHIQAGHAVGGRGNAVLFHEEIVNGQCDYCNTKPPYGLGGDYGNYALFLAKKYGLEYTESLQRLKGTDKVYKVHDFIEIEQEYKAKVNELLETNK